MPDFGVAAVGWISRDPRACPFLVVKSRADLDSWLSKGSRAPWGTHRKDPFGPAFLAALNLVLGSPDGSVRCPLTFGDIFSSLNCSVSMAYGKEL